MDNSQIGVYVHWPFCTRLCPYCDFNIYKDKPELAFELTQAIVEDLDTWRRASGPRELISLHFGGGTPSLMRPDDLATIVKKAQALWNPHTGLEIAMEANPGDISREMLTSWKAVGIERLSIGIQSFDDQVLKFLGRNHDSSIARNALKLASEMMPRVSVDLIYGWAGQSEVHWRTELETALQYDPGHIAAYQLTIEEKTAFAKAERRGEARAVDEDASADLFELAGSFLGEAGYDRYEISNFAKTISDRSRHNKLYWQGKDYVGVGPGAHGRLTVDNHRTATVTALKPQDYIKRGASINSPLTTREKMNATACAEEYILMGLRVSEGVSLSKYEKLAGKALSLMQIEFLERDGLLCREGDRLSATDQGRMVLDAISHALLTPP